MHPRQGGLPRGSRRVLVQTSAPAGVRPPSAVRRGGRLARGGGQPSYPSLRQI